MKKKISDYMMKRLDEEFLHTTDTLWANEVEANLMVGRVLLFTIVLVVVAIILDFVGVFTVDRSAMLSTCGQALVELGVGAGLCFYFKGKKKWLKIVLLLLYTIVIARLSSVLTHNITLVLVFPVVLSIRYYSQAVSAFTAVVTTLLAGVSAYAAVMWKMGIINLNIIPLEPGTILTVTENGLRNTIMSQATLNYEQIWIETLKGDFLPKFIAFILISIICVEIAKMGRKAIFDQESEAKKTERISSELNLASDIQLNMLPNIFPAFPERKDFDIYATMHPAKEVGGDFYDYFMIDENHLALVIADVSGKGVPAAMFMVIAKTLIKDHAQLGLSPQEVFTRVNGLLCEGNDAGLFVTAWMGILDLTSGELTYVNAGHNPPVVVLNNEISYLKARPGFVLAGMDGLKYKEEVLQMHIGDKLFLYTDGITEATSLDKELYGEDRLLNCLTNHKGDNVVNALLSVRDDVAEFVGKAEQFDDMTMLAFDYSPKGDDEMVQKTFDADRNLLHEVLEFTEGELEKHDCNMKTQMMISVMIEEIFVNIASYAYKDKKGSATIGLQFEGDDVIVSFLDSGVPFNPLEKEDPDITLSAEERDIGGLGIYMVKKTMDDVKYERRGNENFLSFRKGIH